MEECLTQVKLTNMHCKKSFQIKMIQIRPVTKTPNDLSQLISLVILVLRAYSFFRQFIFCSQHFFSAEHIRLLWLNLPGEGSCIVYFPSNFLSQISRGVEQLLSLMQAAAAAASWVLHRAGKPPAWHPPSASHRRFFFPVSQLGGSVFCPHLTNQKPSALWSRLLWKMNNSDIFFFLAYED